MEFLQNTNEIIDISTWQNLKVYEEGSKRKKEIFSPEQINKENSFLKPNHRYLLKYSTDTHEKIHKEQFWIEIFAYYFGKLIDIEVPKTFLAIDNKGENGALSEWFYLDILSFQKEFKKKVEVCFSNLISGYNFVSAKIEGYDQKKGTEHNLDTIFEIMEDVKIENWLETWIKIFIFDTLLGNTDRHQDNWGVLYSYNKKNLFSTLSPAFDNGTSMGYEILEEKMDNFDFDNYIKKGCHHIKLTLQSEKKIKHLDLISELIKRYDKTARDIILKMLNFKKEDVANILEYLVKFKITVPLTEKRAEFMLNLLLRRKNLILKEIN